MAWVDKIIPTQQTGAYNLKQGRLELTVFEDTKDSFKAVQYITVADGASINKQGKKVYLFGCLRRDANKTDILWFYELTENFKNTGLIIFYWKASQVLTWSAINMIKSVICHHP